MSNLAREQLLARIHGRLNELGWSENKASAEAGLERTFLSQLRRRPDRSPTIDNLKAICDALGLRLAWVTFGQGRRLIDDPDPSADVYFVPVVSWVGASPFAEVPSIDPAQITRTVGIHDLGAGDFIALTVRGDSMDRIAPDGATIIVDRSDTVLVPRGFYVFASPEGEEATFKRWMTNPSRLEPYSTNLTHEPIFVQQPPNVIGRVRKILIDV